MGRADPDSRAGRGRWWGARPRRGRLPARRRCAVPGTGPPGVEEDAGDQDDDEPEPADEKGHEEADDAGPGQLVARGHPADPELLAPARGAVEGERAVGGVEQAHGLPAVEREARVGEAELHRSPRGVGDAAPWDPSALDHEEAALGVRRDDDRVRPRGAEHGVVVRDVQAEPPEGDPGDDQGGCHEEAADQEPHPARSLLRRRPRCERGRVRRVRPVGHAHGQHPAGFPRNLWVLAESLLEPVASGPSQPIETAHRGLRPCPHTLVREPHPHTIFEETPQPWPSRSA